MVQMEKICSESDLFFFVNKEKEKNSNNPMQTTYRYSMKNKNNF